MFLFSHGFFAFNNNFNRLCDQPVCDRFGSHLYRHLRNPFIRSELRKDNGRVSRRSSIDNLQEILTILLADFEEKPFVNITVRRSRRSAAR